MHVNECQACLLPVFAAFQVCHQILLKLLQNFQLLNSTSSLNFDLEYRFLSAKHQQLIFRISLWTLRTIEEPLFFESGLQVWMIIFYYFLV